MAILRNREVTYLGPVSGHDSSQPVRVEDKHGIIEIVKASELRFTEDEKKDMLKYEENQINGFNTISDKELKELRDSQDPEKVDPEFAKAVEDRRNYDRQSVQITERPDTSKVSPRSAEQSKNAQLKETQSKNKAK